MTNKQTTLKEKYLKDAMPALREEFDIKNPMAAPRIDKVVVNMGTGDRLRNKDLAEKIKSDFALITGQKPKVQPARLSIAGFSLREGMPVGLSATLRGRRMYDFLEKLIAIVLPRLRDFKGVPAKFDKAGNYTLGFIENSVFPEIDLAKLDKPQGLEVTIVIKSSDPEKSKKLLSLMGMPFKKDDN